jgi:hypothetical protein
MLLTGFSGARFAAITIWGSKAWGGRYPLVSAFTSLLSTLVAVMQVISLRCPLVIYLFDMGYYRLYELFLSDKSRVVTVAFREQFGNMDKHREHKAHQYNIRSEYRRKRGASFGFGRDKQEISENEKSATPV